MLGIFELIKSKCPVKLPLNYLAFIIPVFFIFLLLEYKLAKHKKKEHYFKHESSVANVSIILSLCIA